MGISRVPQQEDAESKRPFQVLTKTLEPVAYASKKLYQSDPKGFLELIVLGLLVTMTFIGEIFTNLPWGWYLALLLLIGGYFKVVPVQAIKKLLKKRKK